MLYHISCTALKFCSKDRIINVCIDSQAVFFFFFYYSDSVLCNTCKFIFLMPEEMESYVHLQLTSRQQRHIQNSPKSQCWILVHILRKGLHFLNTVYHMAQFCSKLKLLPVVSQRVTSSKKTFLSSPMGLAQRTAAVSLMYIPAAERPWQAGAAPSPRPAC